MNLSFERLVLNGFKCFDKAELDLSTYPVGLHFLRGRNVAEPRLGSNGAGKSSLWDALTWCLFGRTPSRLKGPDIRAWQSSKPANVLLEMSGQRIQRQAGPNRLLLNEKEVGQEKIDELLGMNADTFLHTIVMGQGRPLFFDLEPKAKMELFSSVLNLDRWDERAVAANEKVGRLNVLKGELTTEFILLNERRDVALKELAGLKERAEDFEADRERKLKALDKEVSEAKRRLEKLSEQRDKADLSYDGAMTELKQIEKDSAGLYRELNEAGLDQEKHDLKVAAWEEERDECNFELEQLPDVCSKCGQPLGGAERKAYKRELEDRRDRIVQKIKRDPLVPHLANRVRQAKEAEQRMHAQALGFRKIADEARAILDFAQPECIKLKATIDARDGQETELREGSNPYHDQITARRKEASKLKATISELDDRITRLEGQIERTKFWVKGFRDVRLYVIDEVLQELELTTNALLADVGLADWQVRYDIERETKKGTTQRGLNVVILSPDNKEPVKWEAWSGGEGQRLRIIGALALADVLLAHAGIQADMEVLDEPTQHLSAEGVRDLCDYLAFRAQQLGKAIFYVDHQSIESARFSTVTTVVKDAQGARLSAAS